MAVSEQDQRLLEGMRDGAGRLDGFTSSVEAQVNAAPVEAEEAERALGWLRSASDGLTRAASALTAARSRAQEDYVISRLLAEAGLRRLGKLSGLNGLLPPVNDVLYSQASSRSAEAPAPAPMPAPSDE